MSTVKASRSGKAARSTFPTRPLASKESTITEAGAKYRFQVLTDGILRYEWAEDGRFEDRPSTLVINRDLPTPNFRVIQNDNSLEIITSNYHLQYDKKRFTAGGMTATIAIHDFGRWRFFGGFGLWRYGEVPSDDLGGTARTLDGVDGRIPLEGGIMGRTGFAFIDDSKTMLFDDQGWIGRREEGDRIDGYLFAYGRDYRGAMRDFYKVTGPTPLLPRWALGNWWSRYYPYHDAEYIELMDRFKDEGVPLSVAVIDMDWHLVDDTRVQSADSAGWTGYTWDDKLFPHPDRFMSEIHKRNLHITLNDHPASGVYSFEDAYQDVATALGYKTTDVVPNPIPFNITDRRFADAFFDVLRRPIENQGLDFWWCDWQQGRDSLIPGTDPLWLLNHFSYLDNARGGKRPLHFSRYAGPGSHRYPIGFSGDTFITWTSLAFQPEFTATASNVGYGWWSNDIGGHMHGIHDEELHTRWLQLGVFSPIMRLHSTMNVFVTKEPWNFSVEHEIIQKRFLRLRHRLLPYLYSMNVRSTRGQPLIEPMYWSHPVHTEAYEVPNQYHFGSNLLIIPITSPADSSTRQATTRGWLPPRTYVDIFTETVYSGDRFLQFSRPIADYPVLAPAGAIIPLDGSDVPDNGCPAITKCELLVVVGADGEFELNEDDDAEVNSMKSRTTIINYSHADGRVTIGASEIVEGLSSEIDWTVRFLAGTAPSQVSCSIDGKQQHSVTPKPNSRGFSVSLGSVPVTSSATISIGANPPLHNPIKVVKEQVLNVLRKAHVENDLKERVWERVEKEEDKAVMVQRVQGFSGDLGTAMTDMLLEILLAQV